jgi:hypothetical protein
MTSLLEYPVLEYAITRYIILLLILKLYAYWPILFKNGQSIEVVNLKSEKRCDNVATVLFGFSGVFFIILIIPIFLKGLFNIVIGDSFYDAFNNYATDAEAIADIEEKGKFNYVKYSLFKFTLRAIIINIVIGIPLFGMGDIYDRKNKNSK